MEDIEGEVCPGELVGVRNQSSLKKKVWGSGGHTLGSSCSTGALVTDLSLAGLRDLVFGYSLVPLEASDLESSCIAVVRWRGGAMVDFWGLWEWDWIWGV